MNSKTITYKIEFFTNWHCGSGLTSGSDVDMLVIKDKNGFPFIPGKTLKGLLRDAATQLSLLRGESLIDNVFINTIFGYKNEKDVKDESPGFLKCHFTNGEILKHVKEGAKGYTQYFYQDVSSTAINENGIAKEHSLRRMESTIPIELFAQIHDFPMDHDQQKVFETKINECFQWIKRMGQNRHRGLGRCNFKIVEIGGVQ